MALTHEGLPPEYSDPHLQRKINEGWRAPHPLELSAGQIPIPIVDINYLQTEEFADPPIEHQQTQTFLYK